MTKDSTLSKWQSDIEIDEMCAPRRSTVTLIQQFARAYSAVGGVRFPSMIVN